MMLLKYKLRLFLNWSYDHLPLLWIVTAIQFAFVYIYIENKVPLEVLYNFAMISSTVGFGNIVPDNQAGLISDIITIAVTALTFGRLYLWLKGRRMRKSIMPTSDLVIFSNDVERTHSNVLAIKGLDTMNIFKTINIVVDKDVEKATEMVDYFNDNPLYTNVFVVFSDLLHPDLLKNLDITNGKKTFISLNSSYLSDEENNFRNISIAAMIEAIDESHYTMVEVRKDAAKLKHINCIDRVFDWNEGKGTAIALAHYGEKLNSEKNNATYKGFEEDGVNYGGIE